ncbi:MAG: ABC transporter substrate-binding protein [Desulfobacteraceae bacterium]|nr:ABC transporter substrate-binding protein [Desulfobacteraceae bacterium]MDH3575229.1 ABC transporter substrate-binding protein [Desulfobacteraceae bacterium]MDH3723685.1 ABC transporter substrate-binding protein [Desulfobacteraceae bacterium]MDH3837031.1 ABC transporter substrate-binding protein [Desulfobacteraceae bacterium]MDH3875483.1 ABC transporter substrate-binding protein [Desulfobacteraceae bacterium]
MKTTPKNHQKIFFSLNKCSFILFCLSFLIFQTEISFAATIKIGEINPLSGRFAKNGIEIHQGIEVAVAEANAAGGIGGMQIQIVSRDDQSRPDVAISRAEELCSWQKVAAITGGYVDSLVGPIAAVTQKYKIPYVASASLQKELTQNKNPYLFRVSKLQGFVDPLCGFLTEKIKPQRLAILYAATPGSTELARDLESCLKKRGLMVRLVEKFRPGTPDFTPLIAKLAGMKIDVIISGGFTPDHILFVRQLKENRMTPRAYIGPFGIAYESFINALGKDADYLYSTCAWNPGITLPGTEKVSASFVNIFQKMFSHPPNTTNMHGYTSAKVLIAAMQNVLNNGQTLDGENIRQALTKLNLVLPMEHLYFDADGDPASYRHVVVQIQKGKLVVVYPPDRSTGQSVYPMPSWEKRN